MSQRQAEEKVFEIEDLRRYIFEFLRSRKDAIICKLCDNTLVWDKKIKDYVIVSKQLFNILPTGSYCWNCYSKNLNNTCKIS